MALITSTPGSASAFCFRSEIILFGDSITQEGCYPSGWGAHLQKHYRRRADVLNRGYGGYSSRFGLALLPLVFPPGREYLLSTVFWGANDSVDPAKNPLQHVPVAEYAANLRETYRAALAVSRVVVAITPPPVDSARWPDRSPEQATAYALAVREAVAAEAPAAAGRLLLLDFNALALAWSPPEGAAAAAAATPAWHGLLSDGLHLNDAGNEALFTALSRLIDERAPAIAPDALTFDLPLWRDVSNASAAAAAASLAPAELERLHAVPQPWSR